MQSERNTGGTERINLPRWHVHWGCFEGPLVAHGVPLKGRIRPRLYLAPLRIENNCIRFLPFLEPIQLYVKLSQAIHPC
jgi:hypothetical protein